jgi:hypothetical protein
VEREVKGARRVSNVADHLLEHSVREAAGTGDVVWRLVLVARDGKSIRPRELIESLAGDWIDGTVITRVRMGRLLEDGSIREPMEAATGAESDGKAVAR